MRVAKGVSFCPFLICATLAATLWACSEQSSLSGAGGRSAMGDDAKNANSNQNAGEAGDNGSKNQGGDPNDPNNPNHANTPGGGGSGSTDPGAIGFNKEILPDGTLQFSKKGEVVQYVAPVDVVFALDTSGSMREEKAELEKQLGLFVQKLEAAGKGLDYKLWIMAKDFTSLTIDTTKMELINQYVDSNDALLRLSEFIKGSMTTKMTLREAANKQFVVISDDDGTKFTAAQFITFAATQPTLKDKTSMNAVIGLVKGQSTTNKDCNIANVGAEYQMLAGEKPLPGGAKSPFKGLIQDLCATDWTKLVDTLAAKIIKETLKLEFPLPDVAKIAVKIQVLVGGKEVPTTGYTIDTTRNVLSFTPATAPQAGQALAIRILPKVP